jgi:hypothetical protein
LRERLQVFFEKNIFLSRKNAISLPSETGDKIAEETPRLLASPKMNKQLIFTANNKRIMANLVNANAANAAQVVKGYAYNRSLVKAGILHFGVGNFLSSHESHESLAGSIAIVLQLIAGKDSDRTIACCLAAAQSLGYISEGCNRLGWILDIVSHLRIVEHEFATLT